MPACWHHCDSIPACHCVPNCAVDDFALLNGNPTARFWLTWSGSVRLHCSKIEKPTPAQWLEQHQEIEVFLRDRSAVYRSGMDQGAPHAMQVADRFHLCRTCGSRNTGQPNCCSQPSILPNVWQMPLKGNRDDCCCHVRTARCSTPCRTKASATPQSLREDLAIARQRLVY